MTPKRNGDKSSWRIRRRFMFVITAFCMGVVAYPLLAQVDTEVADTAVTMAFFTLIAITGSYVFGAVWEDVSSLKFRGRGQESTYDYYEHSPAVPPSGPDGPGRMPPYGEPPAEK